MLIFYFQVINEKRAFKLLVLILRIISLLEGVFLFVDHPLAVLEIVKTELVFEARILVEHTVLVISASNNILRVIELI